MKTYTVHLSEALAILLMLPLVAPLDGLAIGQAKYVESVPSEGSFSIAQDKIAAPVWVDANDHAGVVRAVNDLQADVGRVTGISPVVTHEEKELRSNAIIVGTIGKSRMIDRLIRERKINASAITGKWESFLIQVLSQPLPGVASGLVIAGSDKRGTIYGLYDLSEQMGVSPWYWWADVPVRHKDALFVRAGRYVQGPPAVRYRGIFLNDEAPSLTGWVKEKYGTYNHQFYTNVFELLLRLKGDLLWPAMWDNSFDTDDRLNPKLADEFGIVMGTSHHEPMMRAWKEWERAGHGKGTWDYSKNAESLRAFWEEGVRRTKDYEEVITIGMRGDGDEPMSDTESISLLERIVADQRQIIARIADTNVPAVPQVWALYKEVLGYYEKGMRVPNDVTLLWCDDNWGNIRRLPTPEERSRVGGAGIYYHFDYVGGPRNYKWLNTVPITKVWEQMNLAYHYGANRIWMVNVGDLKPMEFPIEFFLTCAWNPERWSKDEISEYTRLWAEREFGPAHAPEIAYIVSQYTKYNGWRKPELLEPATFDLNHYQEADRVMAGWDSIAGQAEAICRSLPENARDAFYELVLYPTKACAVVNDLYITIGKNRLYASQCRASANDLAARARALFKEDADLSGYYNRTLARGKWNHMMDQTHIGYTYWQEPPSNSMPKVAEVKPSAAPQMGIAIEGSTSAWPGETNEPVLPDFDPYNQPRRYVDVFNRGQQPFSFTATPGSPWIVLSSAHGTVDKEERLWVSVDWDKAPKGSISGLVKITGASAEPIAVKVHASNPPEPDRDSLNGFVQTDGYVSIEAEHYSMKVDAPAARWERIPDFGRSLSGMAVFPVTAPSTLPPGDSPRLEYQMYLFDQGKVEVEAIIAPTLNFVPGRGLRFAVSFDDDPPQILPAVPQGYAAGDGVRDWEESVRDSVRKVKSTHTLNKPGYHTLKFWMVDPGVVLEKLVVNLGGVKPSYFGPPESYHNPATTAPAAAPGRGGGGFGGGNNAATAQDHQRMMDLLHITSLRRGRDGSNPQSPYYANYDESKANPFPNLPDPLVLKDGRKATTAEMWWDLRRPEIVEDFDREIYGRVPEHTPKVNWEVTSTTSETNGNVPVITKHLRGHVDNSACPAISVNIELRLSTPANATGPVPVIMQFGFAGFGGRGRGGFAGTNAPGGTNSSGRGGFEGAGSGGPSWQQQVLAKGWGCAILSPNSVQADNGAGLTQGIIGLMNKGQPRKPDDWGVLRAWAWGASRALDYFATDKAVDARRVGLEGHSRYGKATIVAMAYDPRFAIAYVSSSGEGGAKLHRRDWGEIVENVAATGEYHWMAGNFIKYAGPLNWGDLPVDAHELVALCAPRPVFLSAGATKGDGWVDAKGTFLAGVGAGPVYRLLGKKDLGATEFPPIETPLVEGDLAFRQHGGGHTDGPNWPTFLTFADRYFAKLSTDGPGP